MNEAERLYKVVADSMNVESRPNLARSAYQSRTQFHRLFRALLAETPAAMRRRLLLERAAWQLGRAADAVTEIALDAQYGSLERYNSAEEEFQRVMCAVRARAGWNDIFVDELCHPPETFTFGGVLAHIVTFNSYRRLTAAAALRSFGVANVGLATRSSMRG